MGMGGGRGTQRLLKSAELPKLAIENRKSHHGLRQITLIVLGSLGITFCKPFGILIEGRGEGYLEIGCSTNTCEV
jgi:hypothetical protein